MSEHISAVEAQALLDAATPGPDPVLCPDCEGRGTRDFDDPSFLYDAVRPCPRCTGSGVVSDGG